MKTVYWGDTEIICITLKGCDTFYECQYQRCLTQCLQTFICVQFNLNTVHFYVLTFLKI